MIGTSSIVSFVLLCGVVVPWLNVQTRRDTPQAGVDLDDEPGTEGKVHKELPKDDDITHPWLGGDGDDVSPHAVAFTDIGPGGGTELPMGAFLEIGPGGGVHDGSHKEGMEIKANSTHDGSHKEGMEIKEHTESNSAHGSSATSLVGKSDDKGVHGSSAHDDSHKQGMHIKDRAGPKHGTGATSLMISNDNVGVHSLAKNKDLVDAEEHALVKAFAKENMLANVDSNAEIATSEVQTALAASVGGTAEEKWRPTFEALGKNHHGKILLDDYISFQAGSFGEKVQEKFRKLADEFVSDGGLDLKAFVQLKTSEEKHEKVLALTMFQSLDHDHDGRITVDDLIQWTRKDAKQHNVALDSTQEKYFNDQYQSHADKTSSLDFEAFTRTGLTELVINSYLEEEK